MTPLPLAPGDRVLCFPASRFGHIRRIDNDRCTVQLESGIISVVFCDQLIRASAPAPTTRDWHPLTLREGRP